MGEAGTGPEYVIGEPPPSNELVIDATHPNSEYVIDHTGEPDFLGEPTTSAEAEKQRRLFGIPIPSKRMRVVMAISGLATAAAGAFAAVKAGSGGNDESALRGYEPGASATTQITNTPPPTEAPPAGVTIGKTPEVVKPAAIPTSVPSVEGTIIGGKDVPSLTPQEAKTATLDVTPTPTETPKPTEKPVPKWNIDVKVEGKSSTGVTVEQQVKLLQDTLASFPNTGDIKIDLVAGGSSDAGAREIQIGRELSPEAMVWTIAHEMTHHFDVALNEKELSKYLTAEQIANLKSLREQALSDSVWGREYPELSKMLNPLKNDLSISGYTKYNRDQIAQLTDIYPDSIWLGRRYNSSETPQPIWGNLMPDTYKTLESYAINTEGVKDVISITDFLKISSVSAKTAELAAKDPLFAKALEQIKKDEEALKLKNTSWNSTSSPTFYASMVQSGWVSLHDFLLDAVLSQAYLKGDPDVVKLVEQSGKKPQIDRDLTFLKRGVDAEKFADLTASHVSKNIATSGDLYLSTLNKYLKR